MNVGVAGPEAQRFLKLLIGLVQFSRLEHGNAEIVVGVTRIRIELQGSLIMSDRLLGFAFRDKCIAQLVMGDRIVRFISYCIGPEPNGCFIRL